MGRRPWIVTCPYLDTGEPFPTTFYLTCPSAVSSVSREEAGGGCTRCVGWLPTTPRWRQSLRGCRLGMGPGGAAVPPGPHCDGGAVLDAGIGGPRDPTSASCLHAYTATVLAAIVQVGRAAPGAGEGPGAPASASHTSQSGQGAQVSWVGLLGASARPRAKTPAVWRAATRHRAVMMWVRTRFGCSSPTYL